MLAFTGHNKEVPSNNAFWPTAVVGEADSVNSVSASACHIGGPKGVSPGQKALLHGIIYKSKQSNKNEPKMSQKCYPPIFIMVPLAWYHGSISMTSWYH